MNTTAIRPLQRLPLQHRRPRRNLLRHVTLIALALLLLAGCKLDRRGLIGLGSVSPQQFCPADTVTASFDLLAGETCPADADCATHFPNVDISSAPAAFPPAHFNNYVGSVPFTPSADRVDVTFDIDRESVLIPTDRFDGGTRIFIQRSPVIDHTATTTRITGAIERELVHGGMCAGATPVNASVELPGPPQLSANLALVELCNASPVAVVITLSGGGRPELSELSIGQCVTPRSSETRVIDIRPQTPDISARCGALEGAVPPRALRTLARLACR